jgi:hypothetical protein
MPDATAQHQTVKLAAVVRDKQGQRVDGVPVHFRITPEWQQDANLLPQSVIAEHGVARTFFKSTMPGRVAITAQAGNATDTATLTVSAEGSSISDNYRHNTSGEATDSIVP